MARIEAEPVMIAVGKPAASLDLVAAGWALAIALIVIFITCDVLRYLSPNFGVANGWVALFATHPEHFAATLIEGILASFAAAWLAAVLFVPVYNRLAQWRCS